MTALAVLACADLAFALLPSIAGHSPPALSPWAAAAARFLAAVGFAVAALTPSRRVVSPRASARRRIALAVAVVLAIGAVAVVAGAGLPDAVDPALSPAAAGHPRVVGNPILVCLQAILVLLYAAAAAGFLRRYRADGDALVAWLAGAALLAAFARVNYFLFPSLYTEWVFTGDFFRLASSLALLVGVFLEVRANQDQLAAEAVFHERRRLARDLHDSIAQDLAFIRGQSAGLAERGIEPGHLARIAGAAQRALDESRSAITALARPIDEPLDVTLEDVAREITDWHAAELDVEIEAGLTVAVEVREALIRIVREAVTNAVRHGHASRIRIEARRREGLLVRVSDDGTGFDTDAVVRSGSFGLTSMRERAESLGGRLDVLSGPGRGTAVMVTLS